MQIELNAPSLTIEKDDTRAATDPTVSAWVSANAGAGKTRLLTNRVLRLLLSDVAPQRILCITYTTAAAAEMKARIHAELSRWALASEEALTQALANLTGFIPDQLTQARARTLFTRVLESPEGLRIQTIHGFCQSLLKRFPLEAGTQPYFNVIDERGAAELIREAAMRLYARESEPAPESEALVEALHFIAGRLSESSFRELISELVRERRHVHDMLLTSGGIKALQASLYRTLKLEPRQTLHGLMQEFFQYAPHERALLARAADALTQGSGKEAERGALLASWLETPAQQIHLLDAYSDIYLTKTGEPRAKLSNKNTITDELLLQALRDEQDRVLEFQARRKSLQIAEVSVRMMRIAESLITLYEALKSQRAALDYDDLILTSRDLLQRPGVAPWVLYKLDGGIDHILLDEAQDTAPEQWQIIEALTEEFFSGLSAREDVERTLFVVGDEKQSIYSFQGADPEAFGRMRAFFRERLRNAGKKFLEIDLLKSYRSSGPVLSAVDAVFHDMDAHHPIRHELTRIDEAGRVELWPLIEPQEKAESEPWELPLTLRSSQSPTQKLAHCIADAIAGWLSSRRMLPAKGRAVEPGDIMVLVRRRSEFVDMLIRSLKRRNVPVAGIDRMMLTDNLAVRDMMALGQFLLLPSDDLTLAALLRSPLFGLSDEQLFQLAYQREEQSIWQRLLSMQGHDPDFRYAVECLTGWMYKVDFCTPYSLYAHVLEACDARRRITGRMGEEYNDALDEFLGQALKYESEHTPSMQGFLHWLERGQSLIKRDMEHGRNEVRILTVHGAKGLQAPIVIMPDTTQVPRKSDRLLWLEREGSPDLVFWSPSVKGDDALTAELRESRKAAEEREYRRLLYVAMTRAEDELYLCGAKSRDKLPENCWYELVKRALEPFAQPSDTPCGEGMAVSAPQRKEVRLRAMKEQIIFSPESMPAFLTQKAPPELPIAHPLIPSRLGNDETPVFSPLTEAKLFTRGKLMHALLQRLPDIAPEKRADAATKILRRLDGNLTSAEREQMMREVFDILAHPEWGKLFTPGARAEVPVCGTITFQGKQLPVSGQIDRLAIHDDEVWIVDYKTHREAPKSFERTPTLYLRQMAAYRALIADIYPTKRIRCAIIWTSTPKLMEIPASTLPF